MYCCAHAPSTNISQLHTYVDAAAFISFDESSLYLFKGVEVNYPIHSGAVIHVLPGRGLRDTQGPFKGQYVLNLYALAAQFVLKKSQFGDQP